MLTPTPLQTTYTQYEKVAQVGMPGSMVPWSVDTRILEDPTGDGVGFGLAVCQGYKSDKGATLGQLSGGAFVGITRATINLPHVAKSNLDDAIYRAVDTYYDGDNVAVHTLGDIWVAPDGVVAAGSPVYFDASSGRLGPSGISNAVLIDNAIWITSLPNANSKVDFNGLALVRLGSMA